LPSDRSPRLVRAAQIALAGLQEEALTGTRTVLDVLVQEQQLFTTQQQLVTSEHDAALAEFNIAAAAGLLTRPSSGSGCRSTTWDAITRR
jgi:outer membrane protein